VVICDTVVSLLVPTRYQINHDRNQAKEQSGMDRNTAFLTTKYFIEKIISLVIQSY
jgi:hypothetical protein